MESLPLDPPLDVTLTCGFINKNTQLDTSSRSIPSMRNSCWIYHPSTLYPFIPLSMHLSVCTSWTATIRRSRKNTPKLVMELLDRLQRLFVNDGIGQVRAVPTVECLVPAPARHALPQTLLALTVPHSAFAATSHSFEISTSSLMHRIEPQAQRFIKPSGNCSLGILELDPPLETGLADPNSHLLLSTALHQFTAPETT
jgi:hypothetical protein